MVAGNLSTEFHTCRIFHYYDNGAFPWPQRRCCEVGWGAFIQSGGRFAPFGSASVTQIPQISVDAGVRSPPHSKLSGRVFGGILDNLESIKSREFLRAQNFFRV